MYCGKCGKQLPGKGKFCGACGWSIPSLAHEKDEGEVTLNDVPLVQNQNEYWYRQDQIEQKTDPIMSEQKMDSENNTNNENQSPRKKISIFELFVGVFSFSATAIALGVFIYGILTYFNLF